MIATAVLTRLFSCQNQKDEPFDFDNLKVPATGLFQIIMILVFDIILFSKEINVLEWEITVISPLRLLTGTVAFMLLVLTIVPVTDLFEINAWISSLIFQFIMKFVLLLCVMVAVVYAEDKYTDKYDNIDLDEILGNRRLLLAYFNCIMDKGKCTAEGKELKGK